jgi:threonine/homoserine/homoserine lactone efflux protein
MQMSVELLAVFGTAFVVGLSGAMMPGPLLVFTIDETTRRGWSTGPLVIIGHMILEGLLVSAVFLGMGGILQHAVFIRAVSLAGGAVLLWMGQGMLRSARRTRIETGSETRLRLHPVAAGVVVSLSNPCWIIWWATIGAGYIVMGARCGVIGVLVFFIGHILSDFAWYGFVSLGVAKGKGLLADRVYQALIAVCGAALVLFSVWFLWTGIKAGA